MAKGNWKPHAIRPKTRCHICGGVIRVHAERAYLGMSTNGTQIHPVHMGCVEQHRPTLAGMNECLRIFHLSPQPLPQAAENFIDQIERWTTENNIDLPNEINDAYSILRQAISAYYENKP